MKTLQETQSELSQLTINWINAHPNCTPSELGAFYDGMAAMQGFCHKQEAEGFQRFKLCIIDDFHKPDSPTPSALTR